VPPLAKRTASDGDAAGLVQTAVSPKPLFPDFCDRIFSDSSEGGLKAGVSSANLKGPNHLIC
jgi:hypothetical protein